MEQTKGVREEKDGTASITNTEQVLEQFQRERMEEIQRKKALLETKTSGPIAGCAQCQCYRGRLVMATSERLA